MLLMSLRILHIISGAFVVGVVAYFVLWFCYLELGALSHDMQHMSLGY